MRCSKIISTIVLVLITITTITTLSSQTTGTFLKFANNTRILSLGGVYTAIKDGVGGITVNPASMNRGSKEVIYNRSEVMKDITYNNLLLGVKAGIGRIGLIVNYTDSGEIEGRDINRRRTGNYRSSDKLVGINYAVKVNQNSSLGINIKYVSLGIADESEETVTFDAGYQMDNVLKNLNLGIAVRNIGGIVKFYKEEEKLPTDVSIGLSYEIAAGVLVGINVDRWIYEGKTDLSAGSEYMFMNNVYLRCGYNGGEENTRRITYGIGLKAGDIIMDYAAISGGDMRDIQSIRLGAKF